MGKQIIYTEAPKKPRIAKLAWSRLVKQHGEPQEMYYDHLKCGWVGVYRGILLTSTYEDEHFVGDSELQ